MHCDLRSSVTWAATSSSPPASVPARARCSAPSRPARWPRHRAARAGWLPRLGTLLVRRRAVRLRWSKPRPPDLTLQLRAEKPGRTVHAPLPPRLSVPVRALSPSWTPVLRTYR
jgi:hypothetical protein